jgi:hypothetical protein
MNSKPTVNQAYVQQHGKWEILNVREWMLYYDGRWFPIFETGLMLPPWDEGCRWHRIESK